MKVDVVQGTSQNEILSVSLCRGSYKVSESKKYGITISKVRVKLMRIRKAEGI